MSDRDTWAMERFKGTCPYTDEPCDDWHCRECEVEKEEGMIRKEPPEESLQPTVAQMLNDIATEICDYYCKYADSIEEEEELVEHCWECPLNLLGN